MLHVKRLLNDTQYFSVDGLTFPVQFCWQVHELSSLRVLYMVSIELEVHMAFPMLFTANHEYKDVGCSGTPMPS